MIRSTYLLGFTYEIEVAAKSLSEKDAMQLRMHDNYNSNAKKLAGIMVQGLRDRADLQKEKKKFNEWAKATGDDNNDVKSQADKCYWGIDFD